MRFELPTLNHDTFLSCADANFCWYHYMYIYIYTQYIYIYQILLFWKSGHVQIKYCSSVTSGKIPCNLYEKNAIVKMLQYENHRPNLNPIPNRTIIHVITLILANLFSYFHFMVFFPEFYSVALFPHTLT